MAVISSRKAVQRRQKMYTKTFISVCVASLLFSASFNMLIPELPAYLTNMGGAKYIGFIIGLFTLTAGFSRPFSGKLTDTLGRRPIMLFGVMVCIVCGMLYTVWLSVFGFLLLRLIHGFSTGFTPTATSTYVADVTPRERLGEAMGIQGIAFSIGLAIGPAIGSFVRLYFDYVGLFLTSSTMALLSMLLLWRLPETLKERKSFSWRTLKISRKEILSKDALPAGIVTLFTYVSLGVVLTLIPDWSGHLGVENRGTFFIVFALASLLVRFAAGSFSDRYGRTTVIFVGLLMLLATNLYLGVARTSSGLLFAAGLYGFAAGSVSPALNAWTIDLSKPHEKGRGMATMYIGLEAGIGLGALLSGWYYQGEIAKIPNVWFACAVTTCAGLLFVIFYARKYKRLKSDCP